MHEGNYVLVRETCSEYFCEVWNHCVTNNHLLSLFYTFEFSCNGSMLGVCGGGNTRLWHTRSLFPSPVASLSDLGNGARKQMHTWEVKLLSPQAPGSELAHFGHVEFARLHSSLSRQRSWVRH
jgi:hypothetical protein